MFFKKDKMVKVKLLRFKVRFKTIDGEFHFLEPFDYWLIQSVSYDIQSYLMDAIKSNGYIEDDSGVIYMLNNIICIDFEIHESCYKMVKKSPFKVSYSQLEVIAMEEPENE